MITFAGPRYIANRTFGVHSSGIAFETAACAHVFGQGMAATAVPLPCNTAKYRSARDRPKV